MHKSATKCKETLDKWCKNKHGASKIIDTLETYQRAASSPPPESLPTAGTPPFAKFLFSSLLSQPSLPQIDGSQIPGRLTSSLVKLDPGRPRPRATRARQRRGYRPSVSCYYRCFLLLLIAATSVVFARTSRAWCWQMICAMMFIDATVVMHCLLLCTSCDGFFPTIN
jgi:hypothetical protein